MTRREQLQEQYEDALFALLMDELARSEGEKLLEENERLMQDPDADIPDDVMKRCCKVINWEFSKKNAVATYKVSVRVLNKIAVFAFIAILLFTTAFAASENFRVNTLNLVIEVFERNTDYRVNPTPQLSESDLGFEVGWKPDGFVLVKCNSHEYADWATYQGPDNSLLGINLATITKSGVISVDTENATIEEITINGIEATLIIKEDHYQVVMPLPERGQMLLVGLSWITSKYPTPMYTKEEFLRIVENITLY